MKPVNCPTCGGNNTSQAAHPDKDEKYDAHQCMGCGAQFDGKGKALTATTRNALPYDAFALPAQRKYPIENKEHAVLAKGRATQQEAKGNLSPSTAAQIKAKANKVLGK